MNRLAGETSPYLQQHAGNPVDWFPWGEEALALAHAEDRPILLSVGYSACHWCHVMAHESFEDAETAAVMNRLFVNIKVDREERPDLDQIYQTAHAMMTRKSGGWPLTMFLTPDQEPFFGGTYFPRRSQHGLPAFVDLLQRVAAAYREERPAITEQSARLKAALALTNPAIAENRESLPDDVSARAIALLKQSFDEVDGGFGHAPKFPHAAELEFCLRYYAAGGDGGALRIVERSLVAMAEGGIHDQLGGGFCRYSVDDTWTIPHFEKMLYDNAALLALYADAWRATREPLFERTANGIVEWLLRDMRADDGGFYSSVDADSEQHEGKFYVWTRDEVRGILTAEEFAVAAPHWGLEEPSNFERTAWHLRVTEPLSAVAERLGIALAEAQSRLERARHTLFRLREGRVHPGRDDKILTSWNALTIAALARAARALDKPDWLDAAYRATDFLRSRLWRDGRLLATSKDERAHLNAYLDDYAFLLAALVELMQSGFRRSDLDWAIELADTLLSRFEDPEQGAFFFTSHDHERLIHRPKPGHDNATPSGNGVAAQALVTLGHWLGEPRYLDAGCRTVQAFSGTVSASPTGFSSLLIALDDCLSPPSTVILRGDSARCAAWLTAIQRRYKPALRVLDLARENDLPGALSKPAEVDPAIPSAWLCRASTCLPPIHSLAELEGAIDA